MTINIFGDFLTKKEMPTLTSQLRKLIKTADYNVVNFEAPIKVATTSIFKSGPAHYQNEEGPKWLTNVGINVITLANNHIMDYGANGLNATQEEFGNAGLLGAGTWEEAYRPYIIEKDGIKVALLSVTHCEFGTLTDKYDVRDLAQVGTAWINHPMVDSLIVKLSKEVDHVIVLAHAGIENIEQPLPEWRDRYRSFIDLGCSAVVAGHPHIIQGFEEYEGKPIFYSLGNFFFPKDTKKKESWYHSLAVTLQIKKDRIAYSYKPLVFDNLTIKIDDSDYSRNYMKKILTVLKDEEQYLSYLNRECVKLQSFYDYMFYASGYFPLNLTMLWKRILFLPYRLKKKTPTHLLNNLRCESHRWAIIRAIKIKYNLQ